MEHAELTWDARLSYLLARSEIRTIELYTSDLVCWLVRAKYDGEFPMPSDIWNKTNKRDTRTAKKIISDLLNGLGGE